VHLKLRAGDTLKMRLVNKLPEAPEAKHCSEPGHAELANNPTNIHTHGLIVEPHRAEGRSDTYGDYVFMEVRNPRNHASCPPASASAEAAAKPMNMTAPAGVLRSMDSVVDTVEGAAEYAIHIGQKHPPGLFWFHPHVHGISLNQVSAGMAGIITVGSTADICSNAACRTEVRAGDEQFLILKDMQVEATGTLNDQEDPGFCTGDVVANPLPRGECPGSGTHSNGHWYHTINGQVFPSLTVKSHGSIWRIVNASASRSYDLSLVGEDGTRISVQVLSIDGVTIDGGSGANAELLRQAFAGKANPEPCPNTDTSSGVCTRSIRMMPSSRVELRVVNFTAVPMHATLQTAEYQTGPAGDDWPAIRLADVTFKLQGKHRLRTLTIGGAGAVLSSTGALGQPALVQLPGTETMGSPVTALQARIPANHPMSVQTMLRQASTIAIDPALKLGARVDPACTPLSKGHKRRIYFGYPTPDTFGFGYAEVDENGNEIASTRRPITPFDPAVTTVCLTLDAGNEPVTEIWELVNLTGEDHNFHIHQTRFRVLSIGNAVAQLASKDSNTAVVLHDNVPVPQATGRCDGTLESANAPGSSCHATTTVIQIPFHEIGDFVFHCHILEHEDGGMMARIRVVAAPRS
jgi:FtsP/CotA-like multicopper oxidase with cupredoxin domain